MKYLKRLLITIGLILQGLILVITFIPSMFILLSGWSPIDYQTRLITKTYNKFPK